MIKLALVLLIFNLDFMNAKPVFEISEKYAGDGGTVSNYDHVISQVESEVESVMRNLVKEKARSMDSDLDSVESQRIRRSVDSNVIDEESKPRTSLDALNDIRKAVTTIDLGQVLITNSICTTFIPKFPIAPLNSAIALVCYS